MRSVALRYFNAAGASADGDIGESHQPETHLIPNVLRAAMGRGPALQVFGDDYPTPDGTCVRDYIHVDDLAQRVNWLWISSIASPARMCTTWAMAGGYRYARCCSRPGRSWDGRSHTRWRRGVRAIQQCLSPRATKPAASWVGRRSISNQARSSRLRGVGTSRRGFKELRRCAAPRSRVDARDGWVPPIPTVSLASRRACPRQIRRTG